VPLTRNVVRDFQNCCIGVLYGRCKHVVHIYISKVYTRESTTLQKRLVSNETYLSPYCRSAIPFGSFIPCLAQTTIPTPVASQPFLVFTSAILTALWFERVLFWIKMSNYKYDRSMVTYLLCVIFVVIQIHLERAILHEVRPSLTETWIIFIVRGCTTSQMKVGIKSHE